MPRDDFSQTTKDTLAKRVNYRCSQCRQQTAGPQTDPRKSVSIGVAAHITAAAEGGPRWDPSLTPEERSSIENGIWMCQNHGKLVDSDDSRYTVASLRAMKQKAEKEALQALEQREAPNKPIRIAYSSTQTIELPNGPNDGTTRLLHLDNVKTFLLMTDPLFTNADSVGLLEIVGTRVDVQQSGPGDVQTASGTLKVPQGGEMAGLTSFQSNGSIRKLHRIHVPTLVEEAGSRTFRLTLQAIIDKGQSPMWGRSRAYTIAINEE